MNQVGICNLALGWLGRQLITSLEDATVPAELCAANWDGVRDAVLEARRWSFALERAQLAADPVPPAYGWSYRYALPAASVRVLEADDGTGYGDFDWVVEGQFILTDQAAPLSVRYLKVVEDTALWSPAFAMAVAYRLAFVLAVPLTENRSLQADLWKLYEDALREAARLDRSQGRAEVTRSTTLAARRF